MRRPSFLVMLVVAADGMIEAVERRDGGISSEADAARVDNLRAEVDATEQTNDGDVVVRYLRGMVAER